MQINPDGELDERKDVRDRGFQYAESRCLVKLPNRGYINVNTEYVSNGSGLSKSGRFHVLYVDPQYGTSTFYVEMKNGFDWTSNHYPPFIDQEFIEWIGQQIENHNM